MHEDLCPVPTMLDTDRVHQLADHAQPASTQLRLEAQAAAYASALSRVSASPSSALACQLSPRLLLSQTWPSARPAKRRPSVATSAYGIAGSGSGSPPASVRHSSSRQA